MVEEIDNRIRKIKEDRTHGAHYLAKVALDVLRALVEGSGARNERDFIEELKNVGRQIIEARPTMRAGMMNAVAHTVYPIVEEGKKRKGVRSLRDFARRKIDDIIGRFEAAIELCAKNAADLIGEGMVVMTNSYSSTCMETFKKCRDKGIGIFVVESRPLCEGRKTAAEISSMEIPVTLITDAEAGHFMSETDLVLVGADTVLSSGDVINKMGTYLLALAAKDNDVPFFVVCDKWKFCIESKEVQLEEKEPEEIFEEAAPFEIKNIYFDITPSRLIAGIITEDGIIELAKVVEHFKKWEPIIRSLNLS